MIEYRHLFGLLLYLALIVTGTGASTNVIVVTSTNDSGAGSLREAIQQVNNLGGGTISLAVTGTITLASSLPPLMNIELLGPGTNFLSVSGSNACRPFEVPAGSAAVISNLAVVQGRSSNGGGGILNAGSLTIHRCLVKSSLAVAPIVAGGAIYSTGILKILDSTIADNSARGAWLENLSAKGGAIYNLGTLSLARSAFIRNSARGGEGETRGGEAYGGAVFSAGDRTEISACVFDRNMAIGGSGPQGMFTSGVGGPACGGALYNDIGILTVTNTIFSTNLSDGGAGGHCCSSGVGGGYAEGGAISANGSITVAFQCSVTGNHARGGGAGKSGRGGGASGGGFALFTTNSLIIGCSISRNRAEAASGGGDNGSSGRGGNGGAAAGGGIVTRSANFSVMNSVLSTNVAQGGDGGFHFAFLPSGSRPGDGSHAIGGGMAIFSETRIELRDTTVSENVVLGGDGGSGELFSGLMTDPPVEYHSGEPGWAAGGGLWLQNTSASLYNLTIAANAALGGAYARSNSRALSIGGGVHSLASLRNCLFQGNASTNGPDAYGIVSLGFNLFSSSSGLTNLTASDIVDVDARIGPLQDNGGPTWTRALLAGSPAIDRGDAGTNRVDQRGFPRGIVDPGIPNASNGDDIGAFESDPELKSIGIEIIGPDIYVRFFTRSDATYRVQHKADVSEAWQDSIPVGGNGGLVRQWVGTRASGQQFFRVVQQP